jgi:hypothetical protein
MAVAVAVATTTTTWVQCTIGAIAVVVAPWYSTSALLHSHHKIHTNKANVVNHSQLTSELMEMENPCFAYEKVSKTLIKMT